MVVRLAVMEGPHRGQEFVFRDVNIVVPNKPGMPGGLVSEDYTGKKDQAEYPGGNGFRIPKGNVYRKGLGTGFGFGVQ